MLAAKGAYLQPGRGQAAAESCWKAGCHSAAAPGAALLCSGWSKQPSTGAWSRRSLALLPFGSFRLLAPLLSYLLLGENSFIHLMGEGRGGKQFLHMSVML